MSKVKSPASKFEIKFSRRSADLPASQGMVQLVRTELKADVRELRSSMKAEFKQVDSRFNLIDSRFNLIDSRFNQVESKIERVMEAVHNVASEVARFGVLFEEQNSRNRIVLEGLSGLFGRQHRIEQSFEDLEKTVRSFSRARS